MLGKNLSIDIDSYSLLLKLDNGMVTEAVDEIRRIIQSKIINYKTDRDIAYKLENEIRILSEIINMK